MCTMDLGRPLLKTHRALSRTWQSKLECALAGSGVAIDVTGLKGRGANSDPPTGWFLPVIGGDARAVGALGFFVDRPSTAEPMRRLVAAVANDLPEPLVGIQVVAERLARASSHPREKRGTHTDRIISLVQRLDGLIDDMNEFSRRGFGGASHISRQPGDFGERSFGRSVVRSMCARISVDDAGRRRRGVVGCSGDTPRRHNVRCQRATG